MDATFIIPMYNGEKYIKDCLTAVFASRGASFEVIVLDDGSTDDGARAVMEKFPQVRLLILPENIGTAEAFNEGMSRVKSDYAALLHADTVIAEDWLANALSCMKMNERVFACASRVMKAGRTDEIDSAGLDYAMGGFVYKRGAGCGSARFDKVKTVLAPHNAAALYRRDAVERLGGFNSKYFAYLEDAELGLSAFLRGYRAVYCPGAAAFHSGNSATGGEETDFSLRLIVRNNYYLRKYGLSFWIKLKTFLFWGGGSRKLRKCCKRRGFLPQFRQGSLEAEFARDNIRAAHAHSRFGGKIKFVLYMLARVFVKKKPG